MLKHTYAITHCSVILEEENPMFTPGARMRGGNGRMKPDVNKLDDSEFSSHEKVEGRGTQNPGLKTAICGDVKRPPSAVMKGEPQM